MRFTFAIAILAASLVPAAGMAGTPVTRTMTCPIGGASFDHTSTASSSVIGERPDGKPYGSWKFPMALPECPDNGLVLYKEYDEEELARLEPLIASDAYKALIEAGDTQYYRAYWLMREMGVGPERHLWALLQAAWEADGQPELRARYLAELVEASAAVEPNPDDLNWIGMEGRAINALRELGRFDEARARLDKVAPEPAGGPAAQEGGEAAEPEPAAKAGTDAAKARAAWTRYFAKMRALIEAGNSATEPFEMIPASVALARCVERKSLADHQSAFCERESAAVEEMRAKRAAYEREMKALAEKKEEGGR